MDGLLGCITPSLPDRILGRGAVENQGEAENQRVGNLSTHTRSRFLLPQFSVVLRLEPRTLQPTPPFTFYPAVGLLLLSLDNTPSLALSLFK